MNVVQRLSRIVLICSEPDRLAEFYEAAFGFVRTHETSITEPAFAELMGTPGAVARDILLQLGEEKIELVGVHPPGRSYPRAISGRSSIFQHFAIVVSDMRSVYTRLSAHTGWTTISTDGPQLLPASSGGATAYKFRDPDGHPLELIAFPRNATPAKWQRSSAVGCLGIDHSAISVADTKRSLRFYERLGLHRVGGSRNCGLAQEKLDNLTGAQVEVTALAPLQVSTPHIELLSYQGGFEEEPPFPNDIAATYLVLAVERDEILEGLCTQGSDGLLSGPVRFDHGALRASLRDPDGHLLCLEVSR